MIRILSDFPSNYKKFDFLRKKYLNHLKSLPSVEYNLGTLYASLKNNREKW